MQIQVELFGGLKRDGQDGNRFTLELPAGTTIRAVLLDHLRYQEAHLRFFVCLLAEQPVPPETVLAEGSQLKILLPVGGG